MEEDIQFYNGILDLLSNSSIAIMILPIIMAIIRRKYLSKPLKIIKLYSLILLFITLLLLLIYRLILNYTNYFKPILNRFEIHDLNFISILAHINILIVLGWYFNTVIKTKYTLLIRYISSILSTLCLINYFFIEGHNVHSLFNTISTNTFCIIFSMIHLWQIHSSYSKVPIFRNPYFWTTLGILLPNLLNIIINIAGKKLETTDFLSYLKVNIVDVVLQVMGYIFTTIGFYYARYAEYLHPQPPSPLFQKND